MDGKRAIERSYLDGGLVFPKLGQYEKSFIQSRSAKDTQNQDEVKRWAK